MTEVDKSGTVCFVCQSNDVHAFLRIEKIPVFCNVQWPDKQSAIDAAVGEIELVFCRSCGHISNSRFDPELAEYSVAYENSLHFSGQFQEYAQQLVDTLIERFDLRRKKIVDIGCGKGEFLSLLCNTGNNVGFGFDTSYELERNTKESSTSVTFVTDYYDERYADLAADFVCCRHVLEHVVQPVEFVRSVGTAFGRNKSGRTYFEVPNARYSIDDLGIWDIIYEHCSYFTSESLRHCFDEAGFAVHETYTSYANQFLCLEASLKGNQSVPAARFEKPDERLFDSVREFGDKYVEKVDDWRKRLKSASEKGLSVALWGAGSKGVTFLNCADSDHAVNFVVDLNPNKQGKFVAGTGNRIVSPSELVSRPPDLVVVMNSVYEVEIKSMLADLGISARVECA